jgi:type I restriction-modification system DNA methylase subunit
MAQGPIITCGQDEQKIRRSINWAEYNYTTWKLARMNLAIRGIDANLGLRSADSFRQDFHPDLKADFILPNPRFNMSYSSRRSRPWRDAAGRALESRGAAGEQCHLRLDPTFHPSPLARGCGGIRHVQPVDVYADW